jgi:hypothetical protein
MLSSPLCEQRDVEEILPLIERSVEQAGATNPTILDTLALAYWMSGKREEAIATQTKAIDLLPSGESSLRTELEGRLFSFLQNAGDLPTAEQLSRNILARRRTTLPADDPAIGAVLGQLGSMLVFQSKFSEAEPLLRECLDIRQRTLPSGDWLIDDTMSVLGGSISGQGRFDEAEPPLLMGYDRMKDKPQALKERVQQACKRIVELYESWDVAQPGKGSAEKAAEWRAKLEELKAGP